MYRNKLALSITLGTLLTIGLLLALSLHAAPAQAEPVPASAAPALDHSDAISRALAYLKTQQMPNGSLSDNEDSTVYGAMAVAAAQRPVSFLTSDDDNTPLDYLSSRAITYTHDAAGMLVPARAGALAVAVVANDGDPYHFGGMNLVHELTNTYNPASGAYSSTAYVNQFINGAANTPNQSGAILGLTAAQETIPMSATDFLVGLQEPDGGWGPGWIPGSNVNATAMAIQALLASGNVAPTDASVQAGLDFLRREQLESGGWDNPSANSTAFAIQAIVAAGYTPASASWATSTERTPHDELADLQQPDGSFSGDPSVLVTAQAVLGLAEAPWPILGRVQRAKRALTWMSDLQDTDGSWFTPFGHSAGPTSDAVLAYAAAGFDPYTVQAYGSVTSAMGYLSDTAASFVIIDPASAGKLAIAVEAAGGDAHDFGGLNIVHVLTNTWYSPTVEAFGDADNSWYQAFAILGLAATGEDIPPGAIQTLLDLQNSDGSWVDAWGFDKPGSTGLALQALVAAGVPTTDTSIVSGTRALRNEQNALGSWDAFGSPSANSTAYAMQGLLAAGEDLTAEKWLKDGHSAYNALADLQKIDGPFTFLLVDDFFSTRQAVPAQLGVNYPFSHPLQPFVGVNRGPDPDRLVAAPPRVTWGNSVTVTIPFGSDLDADGSVSLKWRVKGGAWNTTAPQRADGYYTATLPIEATDDYELWATFADSEDSVQYGTVAATDTVVLERAGLSLVKTGSSAAVLPGDLLTYTVTVHNAGPLKAENVLVTDTLPLVEVTLPPTGTLILPTPPGTIVMPGGKVWWALGTLNAGENRVLKLRVRVQDWVTQTFTNTVVATTTTYDPYPENNTYEESTRVAYLTYLPIVLRSS